MSDYYEDRIADLTDSVEELSAEVESLDRIIENYEMRDADLIESIANRLESPTLRHRNLNAICEWLVDKVIQLEKERIGE